jgi:hypothetical protein
VTGSHCKGIRRSGGPFGPPRSSMTPGPTQTNIATKAPVSIDTPELRQPIAARVSHMSKCAYVVGADVREHPPAGPQAAGRKAVRPLRLNGSGTGGAETRCATGQSALRSAAALLVFGLSRRLRTALHPASLCDGLSAAYGSRSRSATGQPCAPVPRVRTAGHVRAAWRRTPGLRLAGRRGLALAAVREGSPR